MYLFPYSVVFERFCAVKCVTYFSHVVHAWDTKSSLENTFKTRSRGKKTTARATNATHAIHAINLVSRNKAEPRSVF